MKPLERSSNQEMNEFNCPVCNIKIEENSTIDIVIKSEKGTEPRKHARERTFFMLHCFEYHPIQDFVEYFADKVLKLE
jgi:hypothetical protein